MNKVILIGRLCADPETRYTEGEQSTAVSRYRLAVDRRYKKEGGQQADFISCVAFGKSGEFAEKYLKKGTQIAISGRIQTGSYTNSEGQKVFTTDIAVEEHFFCGSKNSDTTATSPAHTVDDIAAEHPEFLVDSDDDLPF